MGAGPVWWRLQLTASLGVVSAQQHADQMPSCLCAALHVGSSTAKPAHLCLLAALRAGLLGKLGRLDLTPDLRQGPRVVRAEDKQAVGGMGRGSGFHAP